MCLWQPHAPPRGLRRSHQANSWLAPASLRLDEHDLTEIPTAIEESSAGTDANEAQIEDAGVTLHSYTAPGERHVVLADGGFYDETVDGTALVDWVGDIVVGRSGRGRALRGLLRRLKPASHM